MKKRRLRRISCLCVLLADGIGLLSIFGIFQKHFYVECLESFTVIAALNAFVYFLLDWFYLRHDSSVFIPGWKYSVFIDCTIISLYGLAYLTPSLHNADVSLRYGVVWLWIVLPITLMIDWCVNEKRHMHYRFMIIGLFLPVLYIALALILGAMGKGFGLNGADWPYPFLNVDQLGWRIVIESCVLRILFWLVYSWIVVKIDRRAGKKKRL